MAARILIDVAEVLWGAWVRAGRLIEQRRERKDRSRAASRRPGRA